LDRQFSRFALVAFPSTVTFTAYPRISFKTILLTLSKPQVIKNHIIYNPFTSQFAIMTKFIESDDDLPVCLNTTSKQVAVAKRLAQSHLNQRAIKARGVALQGFFSRTLIVTLDNKNQVIIQLRVEPLDVSIFHHARQVLGDVVPNIAAITDNALEAEGIYPYYMTFMPGDTWWRSPAFNNPELNNKCAISLGRVLARGYVAYDNGAVVESNIIPNLKRIQSAIDDSTNPERASQLEPFRDDIQRMLETADQLKILPLFISHSDLNHVNILVSRDGDVSGIVDWELSTDLPFGMAFHRIHDLVGRYRNGEFRMLEGFEVGERGFWDAIFNGVPAEVRKVLNENLHAIQMSVHIGTLLGTLDIEAPMFNAAALKALPKFLSYQIPALRGNQPPFTK